MTIFAKLVACAAVAGTVNFLIPSNATANWTQHDEELYQQMTRRRAKEADRTASKQATAKKRSENPSAPAEPAAHAQNASLANDVSSASAKKDFLALGDCPSNGPIFVLRQNLKDLGSFIGEASSSTGLAGSSGGCPSPFAKANGAIISYNHDWIAKNRSLTMQGLGGVLFNGQASYDRPPDNFHIAGWSYGAYGSVNSLYNSNKASVDKDTRAYSYGGVVLLTLAPPNDEGLFGNIRLSSGGVYDDIRRQSSFNGTFAYSPTYTPLYLNTPFPIDMTFPVFFVFDPMTLIQYDVATGTDNVLQFNQRGHSLRLGAQLKLGMSPNPAASFFGDGQSTVAYIASRFFFSVAYHPYYEAVSRRANYFLDTSLQYKLDQFGHFTIKASYQRGRDEDIGSKTGVFLIGLTGRI